MNKKIYELLEIFISLFPNQILIIGISASRGKSLAYSKLLYRFAIRNMRRSLYFMMGGTEAKRIAGEPKHVKLYSNYKVIYVETQAMYRLLVDAGMSNIEIFPNCRKRPSKKMSLIKTSKPLRCVFFSRIEPKKGTDIILSIADKCENIEFYFYGQIDSDYKSEFLEGINNYKNVYYKGMFTETGDKLYQELAKYDILLLPTKWKTEGVPGILIESKIAGIPAIVSDIAYMRDIVDDGIDGYLVSNLNKEIVEHLYHLTQSMSELDILKDNARKSADKYYIDLYEDMIVNKIKDAYTI
ncbi:MAG: glycosyltransferase family 4 protein [Hungatella sp.]|nr:glycosyltransferase family 4 protein [Hungatella sp.]